jgi:hypothetical protein
MKAPERGENEPAEVDVSSGMALEQALHDHEGFYRLLGSKVFAIMEKP